MSMAGVGFGVQMKIFGVVAACEGHQVGAFAEGLSLGISEQVVGKQLSIASSWTSGGKEFGRIF
jgi:hypothetical protein